MLILAALLFFTPDCESLANLKLDATTITSARLAPAEGDLPASCRVAATLRPSSDSEIKIEVWMPATEAAWNGKFQANGNGGWSGAIGAGALAAALRRGYATAGTDTGHTGGSGSFALGHPEKLIDFAWRAVHEMTEKSKAIILGYYGKPAKFSYWVGCSSGGKQGLKEAQRFPADYDGIVAGAPANYWTHLSASGLWYAQATLSDPAGYIPKEKYAVLRKAVIEKCDAADGVKDGVLENPMRCSFDPKVVQCASDAVDQSQCLTAPQVEAARKIYGGPKNPRTGEGIFPGLEPGSEPGWGAMAGGPKPLSIVDDHFKYVVFRDAAWDFKTFNFDSDMALADKTDAGLLNAINPDLGKFTGHGGKLILYHGWNDQLIAPRNTVNYYALAAAALGAKSTDSVRLFMVPGMGHCAGGDGVNQFDMLSALEQWVEKAKAPDTVIAARRSGGSVGAVERTRPLCPYPQVALYKGTGNTNDAASFTCGVDLKK